MSQEHKSYEALEAENVKLKKNDFVVVFGGGTIALMCVKMISLFEEC